MTISKVAILHRHGEAYWCEQLANREEVGLNYVGINLDTRIPQNNGPGWLA